MNGWRRGGAMGGRLLNSVEQINAVFVFAYSNEVVNLMKINAAFTVSN